MGDCIIDACVLRGAGSGDSLDAKKCRDIIDSIREYKHVLVVDPSLWDEWERNHSRYSRSWLFDIVSRGQIQPITLTENHKAQITEAINQIPAPQRPAALKDMHIIHSAIECNALVISNEQACRAAYVLCGNHYPPIQGVYWTSPLTCDALANWLSLTEPPPLDWLLVTARKQQS